MSPESRPRLADIQRQFVQAVLAADAGSAAEAFAPLLAPAAVRPLEQLRIYRTNVRENFRSALATAWPALRAAMGETEFAEMAWSFQRRRPSRAGHIQAAGEELPSFLAEALRGTDRAWLADLARLELAVQRVTFAGPMQENLDLAALAAVPAADHGRLRFRLAPDTALVATSAPVLHHWQAARDGRQPLTSGQGPEFLLAQRQGRGVVVRRLGEGEYLWLECLAKGKTLAEAIAAAAAATPPPDVARLLADWCRRGVISGFAL